MLDKKKYHFWQLALIFGAITVLALAASYGFARGRKATMMGQSMGNMMQGMHLRDITIGDLVRRQEMDETAWSTQPQGMESHHQSTGSMLESMHQLTTSVIIVLLPLILGGVIFLAILWTK